MSTVIHVGGEDPVHQSFGDFFDGNSAVVRRVEISIRETTGGPALIISPPEVEPLNWPLGDVRLVPDQAAKDCVILALSSDPISRVVINDDPAHYCGALPEPGQTSGGGKTRPVAGLVGWCGGLGRPDHLWAGAAVGRPTGGFPAAKW